MKTGKSLVELAQEIQRQAECKHDYLASTRDIAVVPEANGGVALILGGEQGERFDIGATAHSQIAEEAGIPKAYYDRMKVEQPELLANNVNTWFREKPQRRMLRTLDGKARALLSDRYRPLDNVDLAEAALPAIIEGGLEVVSCEVTDSRLYVKAVDPKINRHVPSGFRVGDGSHQGFRVPSGEIIPAIQISNSEIGNGALSVVGGWLDHGCTNLCWSFQQRGLRKYHTGARLDLGDELYKLLTDETRDATNKAIWMQFRDAVKAAISEDSFDDLVRTLANAAADKIEAEADVVKVVEVARRKFSLTDKQGSSVLQHLIRGGDLSRFGLANAVTSTANEADDYDVASGLEQLGGRIIELPKSEWREIATAAPKFLKAA